MCTPGLCNNAPGSIMQEHKVSALHCQSGIASPECITLKHPVPGKAVINVLFSGHIDFQPCKCVETYGVVGSCSFVHKRCSLVVCSDCSTLISELATPKLCIIYLLHT